ncbi:type II secretion system protein [Sulfurimonas microaerophilic]|uniref:type II secretion system protein n=1 Tax=Sulfurimonas microaerophilic TaxID=3058392 RepID=UPI002714E0A3|nr:type II secretion system protein [Sulfurimonas sp. hsl 1-7]
MKRAGFTMIELIFVIVILGILSAVALPKFIGVSDQARAGKCEAFIGTLNRTIGASMWSESIAEGAKGKVNDNNITVNDHIALEDIPFECFGDTATAPTSDADAKSLLFTGTGTSVSFGTSTYDINFTEGNLSNSPRWTWTKQ